MFARDWAEVVRGIARVIPRMGTKRRGALGNHPAIPPVTAERTTTFLTSAHQTYTRQLLTHWPCAVGFVFPLNSPSLLSLPNPPLAGRAALEVCDGAGGSLETVGNSVCDPGKVRVDRLFPA